VTQQGEITIIVLLYFKERRWGQFAIYDE